MIYDPLRKIEVPLTEEEQVRQWFIGVLRTDAGVPVSHMNSEVGFKLGEKQYRADILIWDRSTQPIALVECKRPSVSLTQNVLDQAVRYDMALHLKWIILTNGRSTIALRKNDGKFVPVTYLPSYDQMLSE